MSNREVDDPEPAPDDRADGSTVLDMRETFDVLFSDSMVRNFTFAGLGALGMMFLILLEQASDYGGLMIVVIGSCGLLLRWSAAPIFVLLILTWFLIFPLGVPWEYYRNPSEIVEGRFRITDLMLVLSLLVYLACQFRILGIVSQAIPFDGPIRRKDETPARRPPALISPAEFGIMLGGCVAFAFAGQLLWWLVNSVEVVPTEDWPLQMIESRSGADYLRGGMQTGMARFVVLVGLLFFGTLIARIVFGYWRLRMMRPAEGAMVLLDGGWSETHRERQRQEAWRIWGRKRAQTAADKAEPPSKRRAK
jgi:hypothetical protein